MAYLSAYREMRKSNVGENRKMLLELGANLPEPDSRVVLHRPKPDVKQRVKPKPRPKKKPQTSDESSGTGENDWVGRRSSFRIRLKTHKVDYDQDYFQQLDYDDDDDDDYSKPKQQIKRYVPKIPRVPPPKCYGSIEGVEVGTWWQTRMECNADGIHRPTVAGIHGGPEGAYSVALSGGYEDDIDYGDSFTYTGEGGRDLKGTSSNPKNLRTAPQSKDQTLTRGNLALSLNVETGKPVRVIRGYKLKSDFAPESGYRYDGLYNVVKYWEATGKSGYKVYKFAFVRCDPEPVPWEFISKKVKGEQDARDDLNSDACSEMSSPLKNNGNAPRTRSSTKESPSFHQKNSNGELTPSKISSSASANQTPSPSRIMMLELTPGKMSPIKVNTLLEMKQCDVPLQDIDFATTPYNNDLEWHGWEDEMYPPIGSDILVLALERPDSVTVKVQLANDSWIEISSEESKQVDPSCTPHGNQSAAAELGLTSQKTVETPALLQSPSKDSVKHRKRSRNVEEDVNKMDCLPDMGPSKKVKGCVDQTELSSAQPVPHHTPSKSSASLSPKGGRQSEDKGHKTYGQHVLMAQSEQLSPSCKMDSLATKNSPVKSPSSKKNSPVKAAPTKSPPAGKISPRKSQPRKDSPVKSPPSHNRTITSAPSKVDCSVKSSQRRKSSPAPRKVTSPVKSPQNDVIPSTQSKTSTEDQEESEKGTVMPLCTDNRSVLPLVPGIDDIALPFDWPGWPVDTFSVLHVPTEYTCVLLDEEVGEYDENEYSLV